MTLLRLRSKPAPEAGFALIEILISGVIAVIAAGAVFTLFQATTRSAADQRDRSQAYAVAQEDQARMRGIRIPVLKTLRETRTVTLDGTRFTVVSAGKYINAAVGDTSCTVTNNTADYIQITSTVTWPAMGATPPTVIQSIVAPPRGTLDPSRGSLTILAVNAAGTPISGVGVTGTGAGTFSGSTSSAGCITFPDQPAGSYTLTPSNVSSLVDRDGNTPRAQTIGVVGGANNTINLLYDSPGEVTINFRTKTYSGSTVASKADSIVAYNTGMTTARTFGTPGTFVTSITAKPLFPFTSPVSIYAGSCTTNNPNPPDPGEVASITIPSGGVATPATIQLPSLLLTVKNGSSGLNNAAVKITDTEPSCTYRGSPVVRNYLTTTNVSSGRLSDPGLPWGTYDVCASANISGDRYKIVRAVRVQTILSGTSLTIDLGSGYQSGRCP
jgi:type II secretory pathway pseudopilin PulG